jgi:hypothetical protein
MRTPEQPSVFINYNNFNPSSAYDSGANEIIVDDGDCMNAALYHEYRHYWQYKVSGYNKLIQKYREWFYDNQMNGVDEQLKRRPNQFPKLKVKNGINAQFEDLELIGYDPQEQIKFPLS